MSEAIRAYHFTGNKLRDGRPVPKPGVWLVHEGPVKPCRAGLHASKHPFDALMFAPGPLLHLVELAGEIVTHGDPVDKLVATRRRIIASIDATELLRYYARQCAISVLDLWHTASTPDAVLNYLMTGAERFRSAAARSAEAAAEAAEAAWSAAWSAEPAEAAWSAAAAEAAWSAAEAAVEAADAAWSAAWSAEPAEAAWSAAAAAAEAAGKTYPRALLKQLVTEAFNL